MDGSPADHPARPPTASPMRRWTVLLVPHDSEAPRSVSVTERALRWALAAGAVVLLVAVIGLGSLVAQIGRGSDKTVARGGEVAPGSVAQSPAVIALRARVGALHVMLDTIRREDARLRADAGTPRADTTTLLKRFLARLPSLLRDPRPLAVSRGALPSPRSPGDTAWAHREATAATGSADSLLSHASTLARGYRTVGPQPLLDTVDALSVRAESLRVAASAPEARAKRAARGSRP